MPSPTMKCRLALKKTRVELTTEKPATANSHPAPLRTRDCSLSLSSASAWLAAGAAAGAVAVLDIRNTSQSESGGGGRFRGSADSRQGSMGLGGARSYVRPIDQQTR